MITPETSPRSHKRRRSEDEPERKPVDDQGLEKERNEVSVSETCGVRETCASRGAVDGALQGLSLQCRAMLQTVPMSVECRS